MEDTLTCKLFQLNYFWQLHSLNYYNTIIATVYFQQLGNPW